MSRLALGTVQFGLNYGVANRTGRVSKAEAQKMLRIARANQVDMLDTAIAYGESEKLLGELGVSEMKVVTKLPGLPVNSTDIAQWVESALTESLSRLGLNAVYGLLLHRSDLLADRGGVGAQVWSALQRLKIEGRVEKVGVSIYSPRELDLISSDYAVDIVQAPLNLIDQELIHSGWLTRLKDSAVEVHTRSAFLQGLLLMARNDIPVKFSTWNPLWDSWHTWLKTQGISALQACLAYPLSFAGVDRVVIGADSTTQLAQILQAESNPMPDFFPDIRDSSSKLINPSLWGTL